MPEEKTDAEGSAEAERKRLTEAAISILGPKFGARPCPMCGVRAGWNVEPVGLLVTPVNAPGIALGQYFPSVVLTCKNCFFMSVHSLKGMGLVK
jgi:hypothetical protein